MSADVKNIHWRLSAEDGATRVFNRVDSGMARLEQSYRRLTQLFVGLGAGFGVRELIQAADQYTKFTAQLKLASDSVEQYGSALDNVRRIATATQADIGAIGTLYARLANGTRELGLTQQKLSDITETVGLSLKVSGATAEESASAMLQLSQAFGSGTLRGEEFNAVNEAAPRLMRALADGLGVPVGRLRDMAKEGKLTSEVLANALPQALQDLRKEAESVQTISGAFQVLKNNAIEAVGQVAQSSGVIDVLTTSLREAGKAFGSTNGEFRGLEIIGKGTRVILETLVILFANLAFMVRTTGMALGATAAQFEALARLDFKAFKVIRSEAEKDLRAARDELDAFEQKILSIGKGDTSASQPGTIARKATATVKELTDAEKKAAEERRKLLAKNDEDLARSLGMYYDEAAELRQIWLEAENKAVADNAVARQKQLEDNERALVISLQNEADLRFAADEAWYRAEQKKREEAARIAKQAAEEQSRAEKRALDERAREWGRLWDTVEQTGKQAWIHLFTDGKEAFEGIGKALKASVIDLLYQITARKWIIQFGAGMSGSLGGGVANAAGSAAGGGLMSGLGSWAGAGVSALGGSLASGILPGAVSIGEAFGGLWATGTAAAEMAALGGAGALGSMGAGVSAALGAMGPAGWALLAGGALLGGNALGLFGGKKQDARVARGSDLSLRGGPGEFWLYENNYGAASVTGRQEFLPFSQQLNDASLFDQAKLAELVNSGAFNLLGAFETGAAGLLDHIMAQAQAAAIPGTINLGTGQADIERITAEAIQKAQEEARALQLANAMRHMEVELLKAQGKAEEALTAKRALEIEALDEALRPLQEQIYAAEDAAVARQRQAEADAEAARIAEEAADLARRRSSLEADLLEVQGRAEEALAIRRRLELDALEESLRPLQEQIYAAEDAARAQQELADAQRAAADAAEHLSDRLFKDLYEFRKAQAFTERGQQFEVSGGRVRVPGFASGGEFAGGLRLVGEQGPELEFTGASRIMNSANSARFFDISGLIAEVRELREDVRAGNGAIATNTGQMARQVKRWETDGVPLRQNDADTPIYTSAA